MGLSEGRAERATRRALGKLGGSAGGAEGLPALRLAPVGAQEDNTLVGIWNHSRWSMPTGRWGEERWGHCVWGSDENATAQWGPDPVCGQWGISCWGRALFCTPLLNHFDKGRWGLSRWHRTLWYYEE